MADTYTEGLPNPEGNHGSATQNEPQSNVNDRELDAARDAILKIIAPGADPKYPTREIEGGSDGPDGYNF